MSHAKSFWTRMKIYRIPLLHADILPGKLTARSKQQIRPKIAQREASLSARSSFLTILLRKIGSKELSKPSFYIARGGDELILEIHLYESSVAGAPQTVASH